MILSFHRSFSVCYQNQLKISILLASQTERKVVRRISVIGNPRNVGLYSQIVTRLNRGSLAINWIPIGCKLPLNTQLYKRWSLSRRVGIEISLRQSTKFIHVDLHSRCHAFSNALKTSVLGYIFIIHPGKKYLPFI